MRFANYLLGALSTGSFLPMQSDYAMEIYKSLNNTDEDPRGGNAF